MSVHGTEVDRCIGPCETPASTVMTQSVALHSGWPACVTVTRRVVVAPTAAHRVRNGRVGKTWVGGS